MDRWTLWLQDKDADLSHTKPCGGVPETAHAQLDDFLVLKVFDYLIRCISSYLTYIFSHLVDHDSS